MKKHVSLLAEKLGTCIIETGGHQKVLVLVVTGAGPEVSNLLWFDVLNREGRAIERRRGDLKNG